MAWLRRSRIELLSLHIPKTGGTSFRSLLEHVYGPAAVLQVDLTKRSDAPPERLEASRRVRAVHGHFRFRDVAKSLPVAPDAKLVTWLRDPIRRVLSNYFYLVKQGRLEPDTILEYAATARARNRMSRFLAGSRLDEFHFVGILESFLEDCTDLGRSLGWPEVPHFWVNASSYSARAIDEALVDELRELNSRDVKLYESALRLRESRRSGAMS